MKISLKRKIDFTEVDSELVLTLHSLIKMLQEAAIRHSNQVDCKSKQQIKGQSAWILYQYGIEIHKLAFYEEDIEIVTWHRGIKGFKAYREFEIYSGKTKIATASAAYLYYDIKTQKILSIPENIDTIYSVEDQSAFKEDLGQWKLIPRFNHDFDTSITTRLSDYDPMGHVNNSVYFDYIETMLFSYLNKERTIKKIKIQYTKEITKCVKILKAGLIKDGFVYRFKLFNENKTFAFGEIEV